MYLKINESWLLNMTSYISPYYHTLWMDFGNQLNYFQIFWFFWIKNKPKISKINIIKLSIILFMPKFSEIQKSSYCHILDIILCLFLIIFFYAEVFRNSKIQLLPYTWYNFVSLFNNIFLCWSFQKFKNTVIATYLI
jgi:hypothetical protein